MTDPSVQSLPGGVAGQSQLQQPAAATVVATAPAPESAPADLAWLQQQLDEVVARLDQLSERFDSKLLYDQTKQQQIEILYGETRQAREGLFLQILRPIFLSLIALHDIMAQGYEVAVRETGGDKSATARNLQSYAIEVEEILARSGVNLYRSQPGMRFDRERHQARDIQPTDDPSRDKTIAVSQRPGFEYQGKVLRPEWVVAFQDPAANQG
ncbi:MAG TPA: nucleotide exchange factor GrpE [Ktedonobacterales bacterium]